MKTVSVLVCNHYDLAWRRRAYEPLVDHGKHYVSYADLQRYGIVENIRFCRMYPFYKFNIESVSVLRHFLRENPGYEAELRELIRENRCSVPQSGDNIIDVNLVTGESIVRNFLVGAEWMKRQFGEASSVMVRNDAFGNCAQMPQIAKECGCDWIWGLSYTPVNGDRWRGLDGSEISIARIPECGSGGSWKKYAPCSHCNGIGCAVCGGLGIDRASAESTLRINFDLSEAGNAVETLLPVTSEEMLPTEKLIDWYTENRERFRIRFVTFRDLSEAGRNQPEPGVLYDRTEHNPNNTGCYSTRIRTKQEVRRLEYRVFRLETLASLRALSGAAYPTEALEVIWERLLTLMAHDIVTGEHVDAVYTDFLEWIAALDGMIDLTLAELLPGGGTGTFTVMNPNALPLTLPIRMPTGSGYRFFDGKGTEYPIVGWEQEDPCILIGTLAPDERIELRAVRDRTAIPETRDTCVCHVQYGNILQAQDGEFPAAHRSGNARVECIRNERFFVEADEVGLLRITDRKTGTVLSEADESIRPAELCYEHDEGSPWATLSPERSRVSLHTELIHVRRDAAVESLTYAFSVVGNASYAIDPLNGILTVLLYRGADRVDFRVDFSCDDYNHRLRLLFPTGTGRALYGVPYGTMERPAYQPNYYWAGSNGDWPAVNWGGVALPHGIVAVLNRGLPSYCIETESDKMVIRVTLCRSPIIPTYLHEPGSYSMTAWDGMRDAGAHCAELAMGFFENSGEDGHPTTAGEAFNKGFLCFAGTEELPLMPRVLDGSAYLSAFYRQGDGRFVLRLAEYQGKQSKVTVRLPKRPHSAERVMLCGADPRPISIRENVLTVSVEPWKLVTVLLDYGWTTEKPESGEP